jgi:hypothetical protein
MEKNDERMLFAAMALMGLVARGESPATAGEHMWLYADFAMNFKEKVSEKV